MYSTVYSVLSECLWKKLHRRLGRDSNPDLLLTSADVLTSRPPSLPNDDWPARIPYSSGFRYIYRLAIFIFRVWLFIFLSKFPKRFNKLVEAVLPTLQTLHMPLNPKRRILISVANYHNIAVTSFGGHRPHRTLNGGKDRPYAIASWLWESTNVLGTIMARSHIRDARPAHWKFIKKWKLRSVRRCAPNFCQDLGEASELTTNAQRVASALLARCAYTGRIQSAYSWYTERTCYKIQRMHSVFLARGTNGPRMHRALNAHPANGSGHVTVTCCTRQVHARNTLEERWAR